MNKILVTYATLSGSTAAVALAIGEELIQRGSEVDVLPLAKVSDLAAYDAVVLGAPMLMGWHLSALRFLAKNRRSLRRLPLAVFCLGMSLVWRGETEVKGVPVFVDSRQARPPVNPRRPTIKELHSDIRNYAAPILLLARPVSLAFFGGALDLRKLKLLPRLFVMLVVQAQPGDRRNWPAIRAWALSLPAPFGSEPGAAPTDLPVAVETVTASVG
jgi:menaquinone-dependent protoporphyrinogen IX oxidase